MLTFEKTIKDISLTDKTIKDFHRFGWIYKGKEEKIDIKTKRSYYILRFEK